MESQRAGAVAKTCSRCHAGMSRRRLVAAHVERCSADLLGSSRIPKLRQTLAVRSNVSSYSSHGSAMAGRSDTAACASVRSASAMSCPANRRSRLLLLLAVCCALAGSVGCSDGGGLERDDSGVNPRDGGEEDGDIDARPTDPPPADDDDDGFTNSAD